jgi:hypothetical protein
MPKTYKIKEFVKPNLIQRIFRKKPSENSIIEVNNLFANTNSIMDITSNQINSIATNYKLDIYRRFPEEIKAFYRLYLWYCLADKGISEQDLKELSYLKSLLCLNDKSINEIQNEIFRSVYKDTVKDVVSDGKLNEEEKQILSKLRAELNLSEEIANNIYKEEAGAYLKRYLEQAISDQRLSPNEEQELAALAKNLNIDCEFEQNTKALLDRFRLYWLIENGDMPEVNPDIKLQNSEKCFFNNNANWYETRRITKRIRYSGPTARIRIAKGLYWRAGDIAFQPVSEDILTKIDTGIIYLTNKRIIFIGGQKNNSIAINKIIDFTPFENGVTIEKATGKSPFIELDKGADIFSMILNRLIQI